MVMPAPCADMGESLTVSATPDHQSLTWPIGASPVKAYLAWGGGLVAYVVAVLGRTSMGVASIDAGIRFNTSAGVLTTFVIVQLLVYAGMQIPAGLLLDRFGARMLITAGSLLMACGQIMLALVPSVGLAIGARVLVGGGDALIFISVLRLVAAWFPPRRVPLFTQLTAIIGNLGQVLSAVPLVAILSGRGWTTAFVSLFAVALLAACVAYLAIRDRPSREGAAIKVRPEPPSSTVFHRIRLCLREPGTRLGFWSHFVSQFSTNVFVLMWGYPFLLEGEGLSRSTASTLFVINVLAAVVFGPVIGELVARHPLRRSWLVIAISIVMLAAWAVVIFSPVALPVWALVGFVIVLALGGPGSMIGFDFARSFNPPERLGTATGIVNMGGFVAALLGLAGVGIAIDVVNTAPAGSYTLDAFRVAFSVQLVVWVIGMLGVIGSRRATRKVMFSRGVVVPPFREVLRRRRAGQ